MKRLSTLILGGLVAVSLSLPAFAQAPAAGQAEQKKEQKKGDGQKKKGEKNEKRGEKTEKKGADEKK